MQVAKIDKDLRFNLGIALASSRIAGYSLVVAGDILAGLYQYLCKARGIREKVEASGVEDVSVLETWKRLEGDPKTVLADVRTRAEWAFVGVPDLSKINKDVMLIEWADVPRQPDRSGLYRTIDGGIGRQGSREEY
ncbi:hypothetical protein [Bradyrhizobium sp. RDI18]|uniref:hypothetical protein n=1 Tax=Bradyrhizobium sp. RDI18 TaxID=3367400 RepID=UPI00371B6726